MGGNVSWRVSKVRREGLPERMSQKGSGNLLEERKGGL